MPFGDGHRVLRLALEYDVPVSGASLHVGDFTVENRRVTQVFAAERMDAGTPAANGNFVILELDRRDEAAKTVVDLHPRPKPGTPDAAGPGKGEKPMGMGGPPPHVMANGRVRRGPHGLSKKREPVALKAAQVGAIRASDGTVLEPGGTVVSSVEFNALSDLFRQFWYGDVEYNLYKPAGYDPSRKYPLVLFIGDAGIAGKEARITLEQGLGAVCWVEEEIQKEHPCFVLAPVHNDEEPITDDDYWCTERLDVIKEICDHVLREYSIDRTRVYTTGQSMGCMSSFELMYRYPGYFAAALCVSGHWDREKIVTCARRGQPVWFFTSEEDGGGGPCAKEVAAMCRERGIPFGWYEWDGRLSPAELDRLAEEAAKDPNTFRITLYPGDTAMRRGMEDEADGAHPAGWYLTYRIRAVCRWLLSNQLSSTN